MGKHPKLDELEYLFDKGKDFQITASLYEEKTGVPLPTGKNYLKNKSAFAIRAKEKGYFIVDVEEKPIIERSVILKKR